jgi:NAD(P)-dependent dehydrogenase (short-subunit alcohol dehydrogenase family)
MTMEIAGRTALVTGGGGPGSGSSIASRLADDGAAVGVADIDEHERTARDIAARGQRALFVRVNVAVETDVRAAIRAGEEEFGGLDIVVNNASAPCRRSRSKGGPRRSPSIWSAPCTSPSTQSMRCAVAAAAQSSNIASTSALSHGGRHSP